MLLARMLDRIIRYGDLIMVDAAGRSWRFGGVPIDTLAPEEVPPPVVIRLKQRLASALVAMNPELRLGEAYMDGALTVEDGSIYDFLNIVTYNLSRVGAGHPIMAWHGWVRMLLRRLRQLNTHAAARTNAAHHYDLPGALYGLFLDADRQYSCAYFARGDEDLEAAQEAKKRHIAAKLLLRPGMHVLDVGCGWGGLALTLARDHQVRVTGITLSREQLVAARGRADEAGLSGLVAFEMMDYRDLSARFDRVVSVGMFEHVGVANYRAFFRKLNQVLDPDGIGLLHTIGRTDRRGATNPWIQKYIFPGGYIPALSEVSAALEGSGLLCTDVEVLRLHYAITLRHWRSRFAANRDLACRINDERFCRMWEFYLAGAELAFRHDNQVVFQIQLAHRPDAVPLTRDYGLEAK